MVGNQEVGHFTRRTRDSVIGTLRLSPRDVLSVSCDGWGGPLGRGEWPFSSSPLVSLERRGVRPDGLPVCIK